MITLSDTLLAAASLLGLGASAGSAPARAGAGPDGSEPRERVLSSEAEDPADPFFIAVTEALQRAGYLDS